MNEFPRYVAFQGQRSQLFPKTDGRVLVRPTHGRYRFSKAITREEALALETWEAYKARTEKPRGPTGHCQICGRLIGMAHGRIAHHGYERPQLGLQTASCFGAQWTGYENARDAIEAYLPRLRSRLDTVKARLLVMLAPDFAEPLYVRNRQTRELVSIEKGHKHWPSAYANALAGLQADAKALPEEIEHFEKRHAEWKPQA